MSSSPKNPSGNSAEEPHQILEGAEQTHAEDSIAHAHSDAPKTLHELSMRARRIGPNQMSVGRLLIVSNCLGILLACVVLSLSATVAAAIILLFLAPAIVLLAVAIDLVCVRYLGFQCFPPRKLNIKQIHHARSPFDDAPDART